MYSSSTPPIPIGTASPSPHSLSQRLSPNTTSNPPGSGSSSSSSSPSSLSSSGSASSSPSTSSSISSTSTATSLSISLVPLLRSLASLSRDAHITSDQKSAIKTMILSGKASQILAAQRLIHNLTTSQSNNTQPRLTPLTRGVKLPSMSRLTAASSFLSLVDRDDVYMTRQSSHVLTGIFMFLDGCELAISSSVNTQWRRVITEKQGISETWRVSLAKLTGGKIPDGMTTLYNNSATLHHAYAHAHQFRKHIHGTRYIPLPIQSAITAAVQGRGECIHTINIHHDREHERIWMVVGVTVPLISTDQDAEMAPSTSPNTLPPTPVLQSPPTMSNIPITSKSTSPSVAYKLNVYILNSTCTTATLIRVLDHSPSFPLRLSAPDPESPASHRHTQAIPIPNAQHSSSTSTSTSTSTSAFSARSPNPFMMSQPLDFLTSAYSLDMQSRLITTLSRDNTIDVWRLHPIKPPAPKQPKIPTARQRGHHHTDEEDEEIEREHRSFIDDDDVDTMSGHDDNDDDDDDEDTPDILDPNEKPITTLRLGELNTVSNFKLFPMQGIYSSPLVCIGLVAGDLIVLEVTSGAVLHWLLGKPSGTSSTIRRASTTTTTTPPQPTYLFDFGHDIGHRFDVTSYDNRDDDDYETSNGAKAIKLVMRIENGTHFLLVDICLGRVSKPFTPYEKSPAELVMIHQPVLSWRPKTSFSRHAKRRHHHNHLFAAVAHQSSLVEDDAPPTDGVFFLVISVHTDGTVLVCDMRGRTHRLMTEAAPGTFHPSRVFAFLDPMSQLFGISARVIPGGAGVVGTLINDVVHVYSLALTSRQLPSTIQLVGQLRAPSTSIIEHHHPNRLPCGIHATTFAFDAVKSIVYTSTQLIIRLWANGAQDCYAFTTKNEQHGQLVAYTFDFRRLVLGYADGTVEVIDVLSAAPRPVAEIQQQQLQQQQQQTVFEQTLLKVQRRASTIAPTTLPQ